MTGHPVNSVVNAGSSLPAPVAVGQAGMQAFRAPEKRIHNQAELDRQDTIFTCHAIMLPSRSFDKGCLKLHLWHRVESQPMKKTHGIHSAYERCALLGHGAEC
jgi:hypothetical protein